MMMGEWWKDLMLPAGRHPESAPTMKKIYNDHLRAFDQLKMIKPIFCDTHFKWYTLLAYFGLVLHNTFVGISFLATCILNMDDISQASFSANMVIIYLTSMAIVYQLVRLSWTENVTIIDNLVTIVKGRENYCKYTGTQYDVNLNNRRSKILRYGTMIYTYVFGFQFLWYVIILPVSNSLFGEKRLSNEIGNGVAVTLGVPMWTPLDADHSWFDYCIVCSMQLFFLSSSALLMGQGVFYNMISQMHILDEMKLLVRSVDELDSRTLRLLTDKYPELSIDKYSEKYDKCYFECLKENIIHHSFIQRTFREYQDLVSVTLAIPFFFSSMIIALFFTDITSGSLTVVKLSIEVIHMFIDISIMAMMCYFGQLITLKNEELRDSLYNTDWYNRSKEVKRAISVCMHVTYIPMELLIGNIMILNHESFSLIVNSAYSTFNIFLALRNSLISVENKI
ncbi:hypothetical protein GE061_020220 [Apolygus lucorum]|uniref:Odorant receptor n=1 Tax=Apolygus lucorum TaxID=248454 RepID=A0A8S9WJ83_APOLU|nr:hypothetical protein GE061_020220 [Apolygus lucorum]